ncbi:unnamed protein product [Alopecurus aequalis]
MASGKQGTGMELFAHAKTVRLKSRHDKYLFADEDELHVAQDRNGSSPNARWTVETAPHTPGAIRLKSRYGRYLSASGELFLLGMTGRKVRQVAPAPGGRADDSVEWEPVRDGFQVRLKSRVDAGRGGEGNRYLRANGGLPPWRNTVTHDVPHSDGPQNWVNWDVEIVQVLTPAGLDRAESAPVSGRAPDSPPAPKLSPAPSAQEAHRRPPTSRPTPPPHPEYVPPPLPTARTEPQLSKLQSSDSFSAPLHKVVGRAIHYHVADDNGDVDDDTERHITFNGSSLEELTSKLQEETGIDDLVICTRSPINRKLIPLLLHLPPNNAAMHIVLVRESSEVAKTFPWPYGS